MASGNYKDKSQQAKRKENTVLCVGMVQRSVVRWTHPKGTAESCGKKEKLLL